MAKPLIPLPISSIGTWDSVRVVDNIVAEAEDGMFVNSARLIDQILRDDRINSVVMTRILALLGRELEFEPAKDSGQGRKIAEDIEADWPTMFAHSAEAELLLWGILQGVGLGQVIKDEVWSLEVWHPWALRWDEYRRQYSVQARETGDLWLERDPKGGFVDANGGRWVLYTPYGYGNAGRRGLFRSLARLYLERQWALRDRARYSEIHGQPIRFGIAPINATEAQVSAFSDDLGNMGSDSVIVGKQGEEGNQWDAKLIEAVGRSHELFEGEIAQLDKAIATLVLGQSQSVDGQAGLGSNDQAGEPLRIDIMRADADTFADAIRSQFLVPYCEFAYGAGDMAPWPCRQVDPPEDKAARAKVHLDMANADKTYIDAGVLTPEEVALSRFGDGEYSIDTTIDVDVREAIKKTSAEQMKIEAEKALEDAKNPPEVTDGIAVPPQGTPKNGAQANQGARPQAPVGA